MMFPSAARILRNARKALGLKARSYDGAAGGRRAKAFGEMPSPLATGLASRRTLASRANSLVANNALAAAGVAAWESALVGTGIKGQSVHLDKQTRDAINARVEAWTSFADADGILDFYGLQALVARRLVIDGEAFVTLTYDDAGELRLRVLSAEQVDGSYHADLAGGSRIIAGIEFDIRGRRIAYHMHRERPGLPLMTGLDLARVPAEDVLHIFRIDVPGQVRGVSWFAPILLRLADYDGAADAQLMRQKVAALFSGFIVDVNGAAAGFSGTSDGAGGLEAGLEPGTLKTLAPGEDIRFSDPADIGAEAIEFLKITAHEIAAGLGVPYEQMTGDLSGVNYSSIRAGLVEFRRRVEALQFNVLVHQFCRPVWRRLLASDFLRGNLDGDVEPYLAGNWLPPKTDWVDPLKDAQAEIAAINAGLMSRRQAVAARGYDLEALDAEIAADEAAAKALGLTFAAPQPQGNSA